MSNAEYRISKAGQAVGKGLDDMLTDIAGERMGYVLVVFPLGRSGTTTYLSNTKREDGMAVLKTQLEHWQSGAGDTPYHVKQ